MVAIYYVSEFFLICLMFHLRVAFFINFMYLQRLPFNLKVCIQIVVVNVIVFSNNNSNNTTIYKAV